MKFIINNKVSRVHYNKCIQEIINYLLVHCTEDIQVKVDKHDVNRRYHRFLNHKSKAYAIVGYTPKKLSLKIHQRELPDINQFIVPPEVVVFEYTSEPSAIALTVIVEAMLKYLCNRNEYYYNNIPNRIPIANVPQSNTTVYGGKITDCFLEDDGMSIVIDETMTYSLPAAVCINKEIAVGNCIVIDKEYNIYIMNQFDFPQYFQVI